LKANPIVEVLFRQLTAVSAWELQRHMGGLLDSSNRFTTFGLDLDDPRPTITAGGLIAYYDYKAGCLMMASIVVEASDRQVIVYDLWPGWARSPKKGDYMRVGWNRFFGRLLVQAHLKNAVARYLPARETGELVRAVQEALGSPPSHNS
jgi:hypothetical protein